MQFIITDSWRTKTKTFAISKPALAAIALAAVCLIALVSVATYHLFLQQSASNEWSLARPLLQNLGAQPQQEDGRFMRENLDVLATRIGEMQVKVDVLQDMATRVSENTGVAAPEPEAQPGSGGVLIELEPQTLEELNAELDALEKKSDAQFDFLSQVESHVFDDTVKDMMTPTQRPIPGAYLGSPFGRRIDPFTGRTAYHTGLDFQARTGTPILAAAGGVVVSASYHAGYGNMVELDHGNDIITRYAHASSISVKKGDLVKRGQEVAKVGSTGRSTGPHLHFEVLHKGSRQDPMAFLRSKRNDS